MKNYNQFITEGKKILSLNDRWWDAIEIADIKEVKSLLAIDKNLINIKLKDFHNATALLVAILDKHIDLVKFLLEQPGIDINIQDNNGMTPLLNTTGIDGTDYRNSILKLLLVRPEINVTIENIFGVNFIGNLGKKNMSVLSNYELQKKILSNGREDILFFFDKYRLINPRIKQENPELFAARDWGLI